MDSTSIQEIQKLITAAEADTFLNNGTPNAIIPEGYKIESLEKFANQPQRFQAQYKTDLLADYISYCQLNSDPSTELYINQNTMTAAAIFDMGSPVAPGWGKHTAHLTLSKSPEFSALLIRNLETLNQQEFIDFIEDWGDLVTFYDNEGNEIEIYQAITSIRKLTINKQGKQEIEHGDFKGNRTAMESIEISSGDNQLPARFIFSAEPYKDFTMLNFVCRLRAVITDEVINIKFRIVELPRFTEQIAHEFKRKMFHNLREQTIYIGSMDYR